MKELLLSVFLAFIVLLSGCVTQPPTDQDDCVGCDAAAVIDECIALCGDALDSGQDLSSGPCLASPMSDPDWVCDVAHDPRTAVDNLAENQCEAYRSGAAHHFVEVDEGCALIRTH